MTPFSLGCIPSSKFRSGFKATPSSKKGIKSNSYLIDNLLKILLPTNK